MHPSPTYVGQLAQAIERFAKKPCLHIKRDGRYVQWSYEQFGIDTNRVAHALSGCGVTTKHTVVVIGPNCPEWVLAYHGAILAGGCAVPIDPNLPAEEIGEIVRITQARVIFCALPYFNLFRQLKREHSFITRIVVLDDTAPKGACSFCSFLGSAQKLPDYYCRPFAPSQPAAIVFTSGTTGKAKGAVLTQTNLSTVSLYGPRRMRLDHTDTMLAVLPLHHVFGFAATIAAALPTGIDVVFVPIVKGPLILEALREKRVSVLPAVPQMVELMYENIMRTVKSRGPLVRMLFGALGGMSACGGKVFGSAFRRALFGSVHRGFGGRLRLFVSGGSSLKKRYFHGFRRMGFSIVEGYGLTETFGPITVCAAEKARVGTVGPVLEDNEVRIDNPDTRGCGELCFRGASVFSGYFNNAAATSAIFDTQGWFHTGDLGRIDSRGFIYITGRIKDIIVLDSGKNVYPDEIEEYYSQSTLIEEIGVFGFKEKGSEVVAAVLVPAPELLRKYPQEKVQLLVFQEIARIGTLLPSYKKISTFVISYAPLPRTTTKKIRKNLLLEQFINQRKPNRDHTPPHSSTAALSFLESAQRESEEFNAAVNIIHKLCSDSATRTITPRSHLEMDLKIDSLKKLDLVSELEHSFGILIETDVLAQQQTLGELVSLVQELRERSESLSKGEIIDIKKRILSAPLHAQPRKQPNPALSVLLSRSARALSTLLWGLTVHGRARIPRSGPLLFAANHTSLLDPPWLLSALPDAIRARTYTVGKAELTHHPLGALLVKQFNFIPLQREGNVAEALKVSLGILQQGDNLLLFPEGTRSMSGQMGPFRSGVGTLMLQTDATLVPVRIKGAFDAWPSGGAPRLRKREMARAEVIFGEPLRVKDLQRSGRVGQNPSAEDIAAAVRSSIEQL